MKTDNGKIAPPTTGTPVSMTLFIPLSIKAMETKRKNPVIIDKKAVEIIERIDMDYRPYIRKRAYHSAIVRTRLIDRCVIDFLTMHPETTILNLGCGLDTRITRVDNGTLRWYDIDFPDVIELRRNFFDESDRITFIAKSVLDFSWIEEVTRGKTDAVLIIAEGLLPYFTEVEVKLLFEHLTDSFHGAEMLMTLVHSFLVDKPISSGVVFKWGLDKTEDILAINPAIKILEYWRTADYFKHRQILFMKLFSLLSGKGKNLNRILRLSFGTGSK